jgi:hypothetical protein
MFCIFWICFICRLRKDGKPFKEVPLFGIGMLQMLDELFWNLPFAKQATVVRENFNYPEADWQAKREELEEEHNADGARQAAPPSHTIQPACSWSLAL